MADADDGMPDCPACGRPFDFEDWHHAPARMFCPEDGCRGVIVLYHS